VNQDFKQCLENKKILPFERGRDLVKKELSIGESDLLDAKAGFQEKRCVSRSKRATLSEQIGRPFGGK
jgi:hypothetical protein